MLQPSAADIALATQYGLRFQLLDVASVRKWGDALLQADAAAPLWAIDLADCHPSDVGERLRHVPGTPDKRTWQCLLCGLIAIRWQQNRISVGTMRGIGWTLYITDNHEDKRHWGLELECIGEAYDDGYGTLEALTDAANSAAQQFDEYRPLVPMWMIEPRAEHPDEPETFGLCGFQ